MGKMKDLHATHTETAERVCHYCGRPDDDAEYPHVEMLTSELVKVWACMGECPWGADDGATVNITDAVPPAQRIARTELAVGDTVFDVWGRRYPLTHVRHYRRTTVATRRDGVQFKLYDDQTISVVKGGAR